MSRQNFVRNGRNVVLDLDLDCFDIGHGLVDIDIAFNKWIGSKMLAKTSGPFLAEPNSRPIRTRYLKLRSWQKI